MFRCFFSVARASLRPLTNSYYNATRIISNDLKGFSTFTSNIGLTTTIGIPNGSIHTKKQILAMNRNLEPVPVRTVTKFSLKRGKRKTVKAVVKRFYRLDWGAWVRPKVGRKKKLWKKSSAQKRRLRQHVFCNGAQTTLLDKMVTKFWKKPKYFIDDPYAPYHSREEFAITRKKPFVRH